MIPQKYVIGIVLSSIVAVILIIVAFNMYGQLLFNKPEEVASMNPSAEPLPHPIPTNTPDYIISEPSYTVGIYDETDGKTVVKNGVITYYSKGSSSCLPRVISANKDSEGVYHLQLKRVPINQACTMDLRAFEQTISRADGHPIPQNAKIVVDL